MPLASGGFKAGLRARVRSARALRARGAVASLDEKKAGGGVRGHGGGWRAVGGAPREAHRL